MLDHLAIAPLTLAWAGAAILLIGEIAALLSLRNLVWAFILSTVAEAGYVLIGLGLGIFAVGAWWMGSLDQNAGYWDVFWPRAVQGFALGFLFGLPVSGMSEFAVLVRGSTSGSPWLTGGAYGMENSALAAALLLLSFPIVFWAGSHFRAPASRVPFPPPAP